MSKKIYYYLDKIEQAIDGNPILPVTCEIDLSNRCQLDCSFCMYREFRKDTDCVLELETYIKLLQKLQSHGTRSITFTGGGEPLTHPNFSAMADMAFMFGFEVGLITNGVSLLRVKSVHKYKFIRVSLDAATSSTYMRIKGMDYFNRVVENIKDTVDEGAFVGISFVVCRENKNEINAVRHLGQEIGAQYVQIKPAWIDGEVFSDYEIGGDRFSLYNSRSRAEDMLPCHIAGLVGVVSATGDVYYCCQQRGVPRYRLGNVKEDCFPSIWQKRVLVEPDLKNCPMCRYMEYATAYKELVSEGTMFFSHRNFL